MRYRTFEVNVNGHTVHAATPLPPDVQNLIQQVAET